MHCQKSKHTARLEKMTRYRLRIQKFSLLIRSTLHPTIIPNNRDQPPTPRGIIQDTPSVLRQEFDKEL
jgi:hypothetical protein